MPNAGELWRKFQREKTAVPKSQRQFVGREEARKAWNDLLVQALKEDFQGCYVLQYYGTGGFGKSALLRQLQQDLAGTGDSGTPCAQARELLAKKNRAEKPVTLQVDFDDPNIATVQDVLVQFRAQIMRQRDEAMFPLFDLALTRLAQKYGTRVPPAEQKKAVYDKPVVAFVLDVVGDLTGLGRAIKGATTAVNLTREMLKTLTDHKECIRRASTNMSQMSAPELARYLPYYFAMDVNAMELPLVCVYLDTYEMMISRAEGAGRSTGFGEDWLWGKQGLLQNLGNAVFAVAGREALASEQFQAVPDLKPADGIRQMKEFSQGESEAFLTGCDIKDRTLRGELYQLTHGVPYHLDLCVDEYERLPADRKNDLLTEGFDGAKERLNERYLRYVRPELWDGVRMLCAMGRWTDELYRELAERLPQLPQEGERGYDETTHLSYVERREEGWRIQRPVAEVLAEELDHNLRRNLAKGLAEIDALEILADMKSAPVTLQGAVAMEDRAAGHAGQGQLAEAKLWQERALEQWKVLRKEEQSGYLAAVGRLTDILHSMALYDERDQVLAEGLGFVKGLKEGAPVEEAVALLERQANYSGTWEADALARREVLKLRQRQVPPPSERVVWMARCRLGWALYGCDEPDPETENLLREALEGLKRADAAENRSISPDTLYAAEVLCRFAEETGQTPLREEAQAWMQGLSYTLTGTEPVEELRLWQEWLDLFAGQMAHFNCGLNTKELFDLQKQVMEGLKGGLGEYHAETLDAGQKTVRSYLRAHETYVNGEEFFDAMLADFLSTDKPPLGSEKKTSLILFEDPDFVIGHCRNMVELYKLYVGKEHPDTFETLSLLARTCAGAGRYEEAARARREALEVYEKLSGDQKEPRQKEARILATGLVDDCERLEDWAQAVRAQKDYLSRVEALGGNMDDAWRRLLELYMEWLWQDPCLTQEQTAKLLRAVLENRGKTEDDGYRRRCMDSAWQWCRKNEHMVESRLWEGVRQAADGE